MDNTTPVAAHRPVERSGKEVRDMIPYRTQTRQPASHAALALPQKYSLKSVGFPDLIEAARQERGLAEETKARMQS